MRFSNVPVAPREHKLIKHLLNALYITLAKSFAKSVNVSNMQSFFLRNSQIAGHVILTFADTHAHGQRQQGGLRCLSERLCSLKRNSAQIVVEHISNVMP